jgi:hypothetical protein
MQMKKVIPGLVMAFDLSLVDERAVLEADMGPAVASLMPLWVNVKGR